MLLLRTLKSRCSFDRAAAARRAFSTSNPPEKRRGLWDRILHGSTPEQVAKAETTYSKLLSTPEVKDFQGRAVCSLIELSDSNGKHQCTRLCPAR